MILWLINGLYGLQKNDLFIFCLKMADSVDDVTSELTLSQASEMVFWKRIADFMTSRIRATLS